MGKYLLASFLACVSALGTLAVAQQAVVVPAVPVAVPSGAQAAPPAAAQEASAAFAPGAKIYIEPMNGFETSIEAAILKKKVPVTVVDTRAKADFIMTGSSHMQEASWAKTIFVSPAAHANASVALKDAHTGALVFAYNVDKTNAARGNQSTAEACAKHLKEAIETK